MKKISTILLGFFSFLFCLFIGTTTVSAEDKTFNYQTYILKYDYSMDDLNSARWTYTNNTYVLDIPSDLEQIDYVTYFFYVRNTGTESLTYPFGTYNISNGVASVADMRFEDEVSVNAKTYFAVRNYDIDTVEEFMSSMINVSFYESMVDSLNEYLYSSLEFSHISSGGATISGYEDVFGYDGLKYTYYPQGSATTLYEIYSSNELPDLSSSYNYQFNNVTLTRLSDLYTISDLEAKFEEGYNSGKEDGMASVDITTDNQEAIDEYINENDLWTEEEYLEYGELKYQEGYSDGETSVDITSDNEAIWSEAYKEGSDDGYTLGFEEGKDSIDIEAIKQEEYERGYNNGYNIGFSEGESSVDITSDNDTVIDAYITVNKYHTDYEFNLNFEKGYTAGINFVYGNLVNDPVISDYVTEYIKTNEYHTNNEYVDNYNKGYSDGYNEGYDSGYELGYNKGIEDGKEVIYKNIESDPVIKEYWKTKLMNGTVINITNEGNEVVEVVKKYDVNYSSDDDLTINIHNGQDTYHVETVEEVVPGVSTTKEKIVFDYDLLRKTIVVIVVVAVGIILAIMIGTIIFTPKVKVRKYRKAGNGYVWSR